jgi:hypothetical protein
MVPKSKRGKPRGGAKRARRRQNQLQVSGEKDVEMAEEEPGERDSSAPPHDPPPQFVCHDDR